MIDYKKEVGSALNEILPTYYELFADGETEKPCITYTEYSNHDMEYGETVGYSCIQLMVKLWANRVTEIATYALRIDDAMRRLGFHRVSSGELAADGQICKMTVYEAQVYETYYE